MYLLSVKMCSSLAYGLVEQGSEALGSVGSLDLFKCEWGLQFVALCNAIGPVPRRCMYILILSEYYCIGNKPINV